ncbi:MAG: glycoside hydrolase family 38 N-terminal domain-containing protein [Pirellulaceae bacterium]
MRSWIYLSLAVPFVLAADQHAVIGQSSGSVRIKELNPTGIFPRAEAGTALQQLAELTLHNAGPPVDASVTITLGDGQPRTEHLGSVPSGDAVKSVRVPEVEQAVEVNVALHVGGAVADRHTVTWRPQRQWTIYHVAVSHHDLGYADYYHMMRRDVREWGIERALRFCRDTDDWDEDSRYRWTVETSEPLTGFIQSQSRETVDELVRRIREGRIELGAIHNSSNTEGMSYEALARLFYTPNRHVVDLLDIDPRQTALLDDVVGLTRPLPLFTKEADIAYFYHGRNMLQDQLQPASAQPVYYWLPPDGDRERMTLFRTQRYHLYPNEFGQDLPELNEANVRKLIAEYGMRQDWPCDAILCVDSWDFSIPLLEKVTQIREWNRRFAYPRVVCGTMTMFFEAIAAQMDPEQVMVFERDAPNTWIDQDYSDAEAAAQARRLGYALPTLEKLATLVMAQGRAGYPWSDLWQAYNRLLMYHEHTNAAYAEGPIDAPPSLRDETAANALYYEAEVEMHRRLADEAERFAERAGDQTLATLHAMISASGERTVLVFNPLNWSRTDIVRMEPEGLPASFALIDAATGSEVSWQKLPDGTITFLAEAVPSVGYKTYQVVSPSPQSSPAEPQFVVSPTTLENEFYRVTFDPQSGGISSLFDKELGQELVDRESPYRLNEYLYHRVEGQEGVRYRVDSASLAPAIGSVAAVMTATLHGTGVDKIVQEVVLYRGLKRIDFVSRFDKTSCGRTLADYKASDPARANHRKEAVFYALPLRVPDFRIRHELAGAVVEPIADQSVGSSTDYYNIQHFTDLSNSAYGVTVATLECGLVQYGHPRPSQSWVGESFLQNPQRSHVYLYLMNNWFGTNIRIDQPGPKTVTWSLRSHAGDWRQGRAYTFGWDTSHPLLGSTVVGRRQTGVLPEGEHSFVQVDPPNVVLTTLKPAESNGSGYILRFHELAGEASQVKVRVPLFAEMSAAVETSLIEVDRDVRLPSPAQSEFEFSIRPHGVKTVRIESRATTTPVHELAARATSDMEVELSWRPEPGGEEKVSHYDIYRSTDPAFAVGLRSWVGRSTRSTYTDRPVLHYGGWIDNRLEANTTYYYRVRGVDRWNNCGPSASAVPVITLPSGHANAAPARVEGLYVVNVSPVSPHNYLALWFYTNTESDVTQYRVYRGHAPGFTAGADTLLTEIDATSRFTHTTPHGFGTVTRELRDYNRILYVNQDVEAGRRYFYRIQAVDKHGTRGEPSQEASAATR